MRGASLVRGEGDDRFQNRSEASSCRRREDQSSRRIEKPPCEKRASNKVEAREIRELKDQVQEMKKMGLGRRLGS